MSNVTTIIPAVTVTQQIIEDDNVDPVMNAKGVELPGLSDLSEARVLKSIREVFRGFDFSCDEDFGRRFSSVESLGKFANESIAEITSANKSSNARALLSRGACVARYWFVCLIINKTLRSANYGTKGYEQLAAEMGYNRSYIYKLEKIATNLTLTQAYLLGIRGADITTLRKLANDVQDEDMRNAIISTFIDSVPDGGDEVMRQNALKALKNAIAASQNQDPLMLQNTDPETGGSDIDVTEEYAELKNVVGTLYRKFKPVSDERLYEKLNNAAESFYLMDDVPDAEEHLATMKASLEELRAKLQATVNFAHDALQQIESLSNMSLTKAEDADNGSEEARD